MSKHLILLLALLAGVSLSVAAPLSAAPQTTSPARCVASGATWKWRVKTGHQYKVYPSGTTCAFARSWATRLSYRPLVLKDGERVILGGPKGWTCRTRFPFPFPRAWAGVCTNGARAFAWLPLMPA
jgi:hypothetical protein